MTERRLAAFLSADIVGFSRLMGADEEGTFAALKALRGRTDPVIDRHGGRIVGTAGDSVLAEFSSAVAAVHAAVEIQQKAADFNADRPEESAVRFRIGVNLGDVMVDDDGDVFGDGVNVAARIQSIADPGGVWVSGSVHGAVRSAVEYRFDDRGEHAVKNIAEPVRVWALPSEPVAAFTPSDPIVDAVVVSSEPLVERDGELGALRDAFRAASAGAGRIALVTGEAGIGKTALIRRFVAGGVNGAAVLWGTCDDLLTQQPLAPFTDIARRVGGGLARAVSAATLAPIVDALLTELRRPEGTVMVVDDAHWADDATLDVLKSVGRRIENLPVLVALTLRTEALDESRFRSFMGDLPRVATVRIPVPPLTPDGIRELAPDRLTDVADLFRITAGNPFFVTEVLADPGAAVPESVKDSFLAKVARLGDDARAVTELVAVVPGEAERWLLESCLGDVDDALDECERARILEPGPFIVAFRHVLARRSVEDSLPSGRRRRLHRQVLDSLIEHGEDPARLMHHAEMSGHVPAMVEYAPQAAEKAIAAGAHREAITQLERALQFESEYDAVTLARLLESHAAEIYYGSPASESAMTSVQRAIELRRRLADPEALGAALRLGSRVTWWRGERSRAEAFAAEAVEVLEAVEPTAALAMAYSNRSQLAMLENDAYEAERWGAKAIEMAERFDAQATLAHALNNVGTARLLNGDEEGEEILLRSVEIAKAANAHDDVCRAYQNLMAAVSRASAYDRALMYYEAEVAYAEEHEQVNFLRGAIAEGGRIWLETGDWDRVVAEVDPLLVGVDTKGFVEITALSVRGRLAVSRGEPDAVRYLREEWDSVKRIGELQVVAPAAAAWCELAFLDARHVDEAARVLEEANPILERFPSPWDTGEVVWLAGKSGLPAPAIDEIAEPFRYHVNGDWRAAADFWERVGAVYFQAIALCEGDDAAVAEAIPILENLGASPLLAMARERLGE